MVFGDGWSGGLMLALGGSTIDFFRFRVVLVFPFHLFVFSVESSSNFGLRVEEEFAEGGCVM